MASWFSEQLKDRIEADEYAFTNAFRDVSEAIIGKQAAASAGSVIEEPAQRAMEEIAAFYGIPDDVMKKQLEQKDGTLNDTLESIFGSCGIMRREVTLSDGWFRDASGVYLGISKSDNSYIALIPDGRGYNYIDHAAGKKVRVNSSTQKNIRPIAICFYRSMPSRKLGVKDFIAFAIKSLSLSDIVYISIITLLITLISMAAPFMTRVIYSQSIYSKDMSGLLAIFTFIITAGISAAFLQVARTLALSRIQIKADVSVNSAIMMRIINLPAMFFQKYTSGELARRSQAAGMLCSASSNVIFSAGLTAFISLIYLRQIFIFTPVLVQPALVIMAAMFVSSILLAWGYSRIINQKMQLKAQEYGLLYTFITGMQKIKLSGSERRVFAKWAEHYKHDAKLEYDPPLYVKLTPIVQPSITLIGTFILYWRAFNAGVSPEDYMAFMASYGLLSGAFITLCGLTLSMASISPLIDMIRPILEAVPEVSQGKILQHIHGGIELDNVSFRYNAKSPLVLSGLSLKIRPGEYVAIVGRSGCGKSTLMRLLLGFETPESGAIYYDGNDIKSLELKSLRSNIGCVMQNSRLFPGSIYSNIVISAPTLTEQDAWEAAEMAGIAEDINKMPMKMNTMISEGAGTISGGQRQRIIIARAIAPRPKILLFDEATSALDNITQKIISDSLEKLKCTRVVIAHRLSTVKNCKRIYVFDNGNIAEEGDYASLMAKKGLFASLVERQKLAI